MTPPTPPNANYRSKRPTPFESAGIPYRSAGVPAGEMRGFFSARPFPIASPHPRGGTEEQRDEGRGASFAKQQPHHSDLFSDQTSQGFSEKPRTNRPEQTCPSIAD